MKREFRFHSKLYLGDSIDEKKLGRIKRRLLLHPLLAKVYLIMPSANPSDQLDIIEAKEFARTYYNGRIFTIVGVAESKSEAIRIIKRMAEDCILEKGNCNLREFLSC